MDQLRNGKSMIDSDENLRLRHAWRGILIPLTRAIDTLVVPLRDTNSTLGRALMQLADENQDTIEIVES